MPAAVTFSPNLRCDIPFPIKVHLVKAMVFPVVMYRWESWTIKKAEHRRTGDFYELWCWERLLRVPWTARRSNPSILKEISPEYSLEGLMLKLKLQYFGHLMQSQLIGKDLDAGENRKFSFSFWESRDTVCNYQVLTLSQEQRGE